MTKRTKPTRANLQSIGDKPPCEIWTVETGQIDSELITTSYINMETKIPPKTLAWLADNEVDDMTLTNFDRRRRFRGNLRSERQRTRF